MTLTLIRNAVRRRLVPGALVLIAAGSIAAAFTGKKIEYVNDGHTAQTRPSDHGL